MILISIERDTVNKSQLSRKNLNRVPKEKLASSISAANKSIKPVCHLSTKILLEELLKSAKGLTDNLLHFE